MQRIILTVLSFMLVVAIAGSAGGSGERSETGTPSPEAVTDTANGVGAISGTVSFDGERPDWHEDPCEGETAEQEDSEQHEDTVQHDHNACADFRSLVVAEDSGLKWAVVSIEGIEALSSPPSEPAVVDQKNLEFVPHVVALTVGQELIIKNSDDLLHNVHVRRDTQTIFNQAMPAMLKEMKKTFSKAGLYRLVCDVHPHMGGYIVVSAHDTFAVTDEHGRFELQNVPADDRHLTVWHERGGALEQEVAITPDTVTNIAVKIGHGVEAGHNDDHS